MFSSLPTPIPDLIVFTSKAGSSVRLLGIRTFTPRFPHLFAIILGAPFEPVQITAGRATSLSSAHNSLRKGR